MNSSSLRIDFYLLKSEQLAAFRQTVCRLIEKAYQQNYQLCLLTPSENESQIFDDLLWTFREDGFIPHQIYSSENSAPILISHTSIPNQANVVLNLAEQIIDVIPNNLQRLIEVVSAEPSKKQAARERYRQYRERGFEMFTHEI